VKIDFVKAVGRNRIFLNWTVDDGNQPIQEYFIQVSILFWWCQYILGSCECDSESSGSVKDKEFLD
jgi:hypothetical protein